MEQQDTDVKNEEGSAFGVEEPAEGNGTPAEAGVGDAWKTERDALQDRLLRQAAEFQNYKRRTEQEKGNLVDFGKSLVLSPLLGILDDFSRSLEAAEQLQQQSDPGPAYQTLKDGVDLVYKKFLEEVTRLGVQSIEAVGRSFNEAEHEAVMQQPAGEGVEPGTVLTEFQKGYRLGDRVLRHSKVVVAS